MSSLEYGVNEGSTELSHRIKLRQVLEFYEKLFKNFYALQTLQEGKIPHGFVTMTTPNKLQVKPDLSRVDDNQEDWSMGDLIDAI